MITVEGIISDYNEGVRGGVAGEYDLGLYIENFTRNQCLNYQNSLRGQLHRVGRAAYKAAARELDEAFGELTAGRPTTIQRDGAETITYKPLAVGAFSLVARDGAERVVPVTVAPSKVVDPHNRDTADGLYEYQLAVRTSDVMMGRALHSGAGGELWVSTIIRNGMGQWPSIEHMDTLGQFMAEVATLESSVVA